MRAHDDRPLVGLAWRGRRCGFSGWWVRTRGLGSPPWAAAGWGPRGVGVAGSRGGGPGSIDRSRVPPSPVEKWGRSCSREEKISREWVSRLWPVAWLKLKETDKYPFVGGLQPHLYRDSHIVLCISSVLRNKDTVACREDVWETEEMQKGADCSHWPGLWRSQPFPGVLGPPAGGARRRPALLPPPGAPAPLPEAPAGSLLLCGSILSRPWRSGERERGFCTKPCPRECKAPGALP